LRRTPRRSAADAARAARAYRRDRGRDRGTPRPGRAPRGTGGGPPRDRRCPTGSRRRRTSSSVTHRDVLTRRGRGRRMGFLRSLARYIARHHLALLALFIALGGTSYAALSLPKNSVGSAQIRPGAVQKYHLAQPALAALKGKAGARGAAGPEGPLGPAGP